ncbi:MAG: ABC transporter ATP-binding protein [Desulfurococcales archaeon]|nr:ABC transporter ATP-binding protein [Desulfurococcales archaeon]
MGCIVRGRGLYKEYPGGVLAVKGVDLEARPGKTALMGPNGSGKTTTLSMLAGALKPSRGEVEVCGLNLWGREWLEARRKIGFAPQDMPFRDKLTGRENLVWHGLLRGLSLGEASRRARRLGEELGMSSYLDRRVATYSGGMRRRLSIAAALMGEPEVLILDEPTSGLDPGAREELWGLIESRLRDLTIVFSTHLGEEAERHADIVYLFSRGRVAAWGRPGELIERYAPRPRIVLYLQEDAEPLEIDGMRPQVLGPGVVSYTVDDPGMGMRAAIDAYTLRGVAVERVEVRRPSLEEVFLAVARGG